MFIQKGSKFETGDPSVEGRWKLTYYSLAALLRIETGSGGKFALLMCPDIGCLRNADVVVDRIEGGTPVANTSSSVKELLSSVDYGVNLGLPMNLSAGDNIWILEALYSHGLKNILKSDGNDSIKNRGLQSKPGLLFPLKR